MVNLGFVRGILVLVGILGPSLALEFRSGASVAAATGDEAMSEKSPVHVHDRQTRKDDLLSRRLRSSSSSSSSSTSSEKKNTEKKHAYTSSEKVPLQELEQLDLSQATAQELVEKGVAVPDEAAEALGRLSQVVAKAALSEDDKTKDIFTEIVEELPTKFQALANAMAQMDQLIPQESPEAETIHNLLDQAIEQFQNLGEITSRVFHAGDDDDLADGTNAQEKARILSILSQPPSSGNERPRPSDKPALGNVVEVDIEGQARDYSMYDDLDDEDDDDDYMYSGYGSYGKNYQFHSHNWQKHKGVGGFAVSGIQDAIRNGDHGRVHKHLDDLIRQASHHQQGSTTRRHHQEQDHRRTSQGGTGNKFDQCQLLVECASKMSRYDMFVYMYERDGKIVDGVWRFDSDSYEDFNGKYERIKSTRVPEAKSLLSTPLAFSGPDSEDACDLLLDEFHRTEKAGTGSDAPYTVVQGIVTEICLAEGNRKYLSLVDIFRQNEKVAIEVLKDTIACAKDIHQHGGNSLENFPFLEPNADPLAEVWQMPYQLNQNARDLHGSIKDSSSTEEFYISQPFTIDYKTKLLSIGQYKFAEHIMWSDGLLLPYLVVYDELVQLYREWFFQTVDILAPQYYLQCVLLESESPSFSPTESPSISPTSKTLSPTESANPSISPTARPPTPNPTPFFFVGIPTHPTGAPSESSSPSAAPSVGLYRYGCELSLQGIWNNPDVPQTILDSGIPYQWEWEEIILKQADEMVCVSSACKTDIGSFFRLPDSNQVPTNHALLSLFITADTGFELVFGKGISAGYVCALAGDGNSGPPGTCCLNAPTDNALWGTSFSCDDTCDFEAPILAGISPESCDIYGGTFCYETDCTVLKECIETEIARNENAANANDVYTEYIELAPKITDVFDKGQCGAVRQYFGFEAEFSNDQAICDEFRQLRNTRNFDLIGDFLGTGGGGSESSEASCSLELVDPGDQCEVSEEAALIWRTVNFVVGIIVKAFRFAFKSAVSLKCPCVPVAASICEGLKGTVGNVILTVLLVLDTARSISEFLYGWFADYGGLTRIKIYMAIDKVYDNMKAMEEIISRRTTKIDHTLNFGFCLSQGDTNPFDADHSHTIEYDDGSSNNIDFLDKYYSAEVARGDNAVGISTCDLYDEVLCRPVEKLARGHGCDGLDNNCDEGYLPDECEEDAYPPEIDFSEAFANCGPDMHIFSSWQGAEDCVKTFALITDDCYGVQTDFMTIEANAPVSQCGATFDVAVLSAEKECGKTVEEVFQVVVIEHLLNNEVSCELPNGPDTLPVLDVSEAISLCSGTRFWDSTTTAKKCIELFSVASDPCREVKTIVTLTPASAVAGCESLGSEYYDVTVRAEIVGCPSELFVEETMVVLVDSNIEQVPSCEFSIGPDVVPSLETNDVHSLCIGKMFPEVSDGSNFAKNAEDCILQFAVTDDVSGSCRPVDVTATSTINEDLTLPNCGTKYVDVVLESQVKDCSGLSTQESFSVVLDPNALSATCDYGLGPYRDPIIDSSVAFTECHEQIFATIEEAVDCVMQFTETEDASKGCRPFTVVPTAVEISTCTWEITVTATIDDCEPLKTVSDAIRVIVDNVAPVVDCEHVGEIEVTGAGVYKDPLLTYTVRDNCFLFPMSVEVESLSTEWEQPGPIVYLYNYEDATTNNTKYGAKIASNLCSTMNSGVCISPTKNKGIRTYTSRIVATDHAGYKSVAECFVEIEPNGNKNDVEVVPKGKDKKQLDPSTAAPGEEALIEDVTIFLVATSGVKEYMSDP